MEVKLKADNRLWPGAAKDLRDKVGNRHKLGAGYKKKSKVLLIPRSRVKSIIKEWKVFGIVRTLPGQAVSPP